MKKIYITPQINFGDRPDDHYDELLMSITAQFNVATSGDEPLFTTEAGELYDLFLANLPEEARQHYTCRACRNFVNRYGGLVTIDDDGRTYPAMWGDVPDFFVPAVDAIRKAVRRARITGVFITSEKRLGIPKTGDWYHMAVDVPKARIFKDRLNTASQKAAEKSQDASMLASAVYKYSLNTIETAVNILRSETLYRGDKILGIAEWFLEVKKITEKLGHHGNLGSNIIWKKAATAPAGFCHVSSSMIGTLLDDIEEGLDLEAIRFRFDAKMHPLKYQRPQAAPSAGNVARAEKIVEELGIANSLRRRFARLDEIETIWKPEPKTSDKVFGGVFAGLKTKESLKPTSPTIVPRTTNITWEKFKRTVLPLAKKIEYYTGNTFDSYAALVTAADTDAPPIILWDTEENRNPFNWYMYSGGSNPERWHLGRNEYVEVTAIALQPNLWRPGFEYCGNGAVLILNGCKDVHNSSLALFPETLKGELREVRSTIEAYSNSHDIEGSDEASACGISIQENNRNRLYRLRVTTDVGVSTYVIDRWD